jgi:hypothetical protein
MYADRTPLEIWCRSVNPMSGSMSQVNLLIKTVLKTSPVQISGPPIYHSILLRGVWGTKKRCHHICSLLPVEGESPPDACVRGTDVRT